MDQSRPDAPAAPPADALSRRTALIGLGGGGLAALLLAAGFERSAAAPQASPTPAYGPGTHAEILGRKEAVAAPGYNLQLARVTFDPGAKVPPHTHPGDTVSFQLSGSSTFTLLDGAALLLRAGTATPTAGPAGEPMTVGREYTIHAGDAFLFDAHTAHIGANPGTDPAVLLEAQLRAAGQPLSHPLGTPAATPSS